MAHTSSKPGASLILRFSRAGAAIEWSADTAVEALVVMGVHCTRGYRFLDATDMRGDVVAVDRVSLQALAARECAAAQ